MKTTEKKMVEVEVTTWKCDLCDLTIENNRGCCGTAPIMRCQICNKDVCREHRTFFTEDYGEDYPHGFYACDNCREEAQRAWDDAQEVAGRHEDILKVVKECIDGYRFQKNFDQGIEHVPFEWWGGKKD